MNQDLKLSIVRLLSLTHLVSSCACHHPCNQALFCNWDVFVFPKDQGHRTEPTSHVPHLSRITTSDVPNTQGKVQPSPRPRDIFSILPSHTPQAYP
eukprot:11100605-Heterocapsa_arctica.AAC.1